MRAFSTIASPVFSEVITFNRDDDFRYATSGIRDLITFRQLSTTDAEFVASQYHKVFEVLRKMRKVRDFRLELCADVWGCLVVQAVQELEWIINTEQAEGGLDDFSPRPLVTSSPRGFLPTLGEPADNDVLKHAYWIHGWAPDYRPVVRRGQWPGHYCYRSL